MPDVFDVKIPITLSVRQWIAVAAALEGFDEETCEADGIRKELVEPGDEALGEISTVLDSTLERDDWPETEIDDPEVIDAGEDE